MIDKHLAILQSWLIQCFSLWTPDPCCAATGPQHFVYYVLHRYCHCHLRRHHPHPPQRKTPLCSAVSETGIWPRMTEYWQKVWGEAMEYFRRHRYLPGCCLNLSQSPLGMGQPSVCTQDRSSLSLLAMGQHTCSDRLVI